MCDRQNAMLNGPGNGRELWAVGKIAEVFADTCEGSPYYSWGVQHADYLHVQKKGVGTKRPFALYCIHQCPRLCLQTCCSVSIAHGHRGRVERTVVAVHVTLLKLLEELISDRLVSEAKCCRATISI